LYVGVGFLASGIVLLHLERAAGHDQKHVEGTLQTARLLLVVAIHPSGIGANRVHDHLAHHAIAARDFDGQTGERHDRIHKVGIGLCPDPGMHAAHRGAHQ
jgi:hypothetical protein